jgi:hypothetical protein
MTNFAEIQRKTPEVQERKLELQEANARSRAKKLKVKEK